MESKNYFLRIINLYSTYLWGIASKKYRLIENWKIVHLMIIQSNFEITKSFHYILMIFFLSVACHQPIWFWRCLNSEYWILFWFLLWFKMEEIVKSVFWTNKKFVLLSFGKKISYPAYNFLYGHENLSWQASRNKY